jgi:hypothetical protein
MALVRRAEPHDIDAIVAMTRAGRARLAEWSPVFFRPAADVDERHARFLEFLVRSPTHDTRVAIADCDKVAAFGVVIDQRVQHFLDDLSVAESDDWDEAGLSLIESVVNRPIVTCVSPKDRGRLEALGHAGYEAVSSYWARLLPEHDGADHLPDLTDGAIPADPSPVHTFVGACDPGVPGALELVTRDGYVVGSPSTTPPVYDPGGPTCVVDRIVGTDRERLLHDAMAATAARGDHQMLVVLDEHDRELRGLLLTRQFDQHVLVLARR